MKLAVTLASEMLSEYERITRDDSHIERATEMTDSRPRSFWKCRAKPLWPSLSPLGAARTYAARATPSQERRVGGMSGGSPPATGVT
ncbi:hypothetical protein F2P81_015201 [Scophthalmus maximus]|uniref:Uncharacterized protein n=1 Tax=Scophthalmus maximus TaxID=52904 RepID=A0A6A4SP98_SCOMX|nr:hypothetical protein F2P81_015201 [Scophthalmus maximus]